ncbi:hypothetical protein [Photobacterium sp. TY1-4]|uniref:hypothetical protein n=1 Tax=Photobacterium sp. TY1-4 TaxID=2899122 RepID=UPI0021C1A428|nr:hypothetical protein [Photobacterium sp. TY1-4]UXI04235.1 hypothetical protein NH461_19235 [Photobacterium sp. TY1-4]
MIFARVIFYALLILLTSIHSEYKSTDDLYQFSAIYEGRGEIGFLFRVNTNRLKLKQKNLVDYRSFEDSLYDVVIKDDITLEIGEEYYGEIDLVQKRGQPLYFVLASLQKGDRVLIARTNMINSDVKDIIEYVLFIMFIIIAGSYVRDFIYSES